MSTTDVTAVETMLGAFRRGLERHPDQVLVRTKDDEIAWTWRQVAEQAARVAGGLRALGVERGQTVGLLMGNRPDFFPVDLGVTTLGAVPVSLYQTSSPEQIVYIANDAGMSVIVTEQLYLDRVLAARDELPGLRHVVVVDGEAPTGVMTIGALEAGAPADFDAAAEAELLSPDDLLTLIYTSGTTGPPKGVELTHRNLVAAMEAVGKVARLRQGGRVISWLPAAHIAERGAHYYAPLLFGLEITTCPDPKQISAYLAAVHPTWFFAVPRIWEKLKSGLEAMLAAQPEERRTAVQGAIEAATEKVRLEQAGEPVPAELAAAVAQADEQIFAPLRAMLGLDQVESINVGAAPTPRTVIEFFHAIGLPIAEIWGMSEGCACGTLNPPDRIKIGTVGPAVPGMEVKLAEDGEVLLKGPTLMRGYRNQPEKTAESYTEDGWFKTGDIGQFDEDGYLSIVDRKKELIINAAGKNMSPANIEAAIKSAHPLIGQVCVIGDNRPYNTALIVLDADFTPPWAQQQGIEGTLEELAEVPAVIAEIQKGVDAGNARLSRVEQVKRFVIVRGDWLPGGDELTPTMKLKRKPIDQKYAADIEGLYTAA
ncbi:Long-chain-fatty-acid--CoA ligase [Patulibacter medicamentivorans]|uniref:Acyl-CoA synthetase n=1 Tax=Patulibacter medicamentivorans TaxID=1097667 RepID=H0E775_9ACTN|nr:long-chain fatty acid--CoA ligase [Patulibacter medicamentivorans]EHN10450.1 Long-chain-fatty-acid--CoA ligase [Patulibacter medicamentivorans]